MRISFSQHLVNLGDSPRVQIEFVRAGDNLAATRFFFRNGGDFYIDGVRSPKLQTRECGDSGTALSFVARARNPPTVEAGSDEQPRIQGNCLGAKEDLQQASSDFAASSLPVVVDFSYTGDEVGGFLSRTYVSADRFGKVVYSYS